MAASGNKCAPGEYSVIEIHPPKEVSQQQLHIHVSPPEAKVQDEAWWVKVSTELQARMAAPIKSSQ